MKVGFVSLVGRPNVGKSTLLNSLLKTKLAITSDKAGTTRHLIQGVYQDEEAQIVFVDTPGIHKPLHKLETVLNRKAYSTVEKVDIILFLVDASTGIGKGDQFILKRFQEESVPVYLLLNKIDKMKKEQLLQMIMEAKELYPFREIIPISATKKDNLDDLVVCLKRDLSEGEPYFKEDEWTNVSVKFLLAELVREKLLELTHDEVPHAISCYVEHFEETEQLANVQVLIVVDRENLKKMIIGKQGRLLKEVGQASRVEMEALLGKKVYLSTYVKVITSWRDKENYLMELGIKDAEDV